jgi:GR25 family glycosyltransferase involved in LPS biosynthesis
MKAFFILFSFFSLLLHADISKYFKKAENKGAGHTMRNIDCIYLINLDKRPERLQRCLEQLHPYGIFPYRFSAVNGYKFSLSEINDMGTRLSRSMMSKKKAFYYTANPDGTLTMHYEQMQTIGRTYFSVTIGSIGCMLSHLSIMQDALDSHYETIWILEDDIDVLQDPRVLSDLIDELDAIRGKEGWDVLFTDIDRRLDDGTYMACRPLSIDTRKDFPPPHKKLFALDHQIHPHFRHIGARCGLHSYIMRRSGMKKLLDYLKPKGIFLPIDHEIYIADKMRLYALCQDIVSNALFTSSDAVASWDLARDVEEGGGSKE